jgi:hypothetical protein
MRTLSGHEAAVTRLAYAPGDPLTLASASPDGTVRLWNPLTGQNWATFDDFGHQGHCLSFSPDGTSLASDGPAGGVGVWDVALQRRRGTYRFSPFLLGEEPERAVLAVTFAAGGNLLVAGRKDYEYRRGRVDLAYWGTEDSLQARWSARDWFGGVDALAAVPGRDEWPSAPPSRARSGSGPLWGRADGVAARFTSAVRCQPRVQPDDPPLLAIAAARGRGDSHGIQLGAQSRPPRPPGRRAVRFLLPGWQPAFEWWPGRDGATVGRGGGTRATCLNWNLGPVHAVASAPDGGTAAVSGESQDIVVWDLE